MTTKQKRKPTRASRYTAALLVLGKREGIGDFFTEAGAAIAKSVEAALRSRPDYRLLNDEAIEVAHKAAIASLRRYRPGPVAPSVEREDSA